MTNDYPIATWARARRTAGVLLAAGAVVAAAGCGTRLTHDDIANAGPAITATGASGTTDTSGGAGSSGTTDTSGGAVSSGTTDTTGGAVTSGTTAGSTGTSGGAVSSGTTGTTGGAATSGTTSGTTSGSTSSGSTSSGSTSTSGGKAAGGKVPTTGTATASAKAGSTGTSATAGGVPAIFGGTTCAPATKSAVTLGNVSTLSGVLGNLFKPVVPGLQTFVKAQNACGGLNGHPINLIIKDDQDDPATATSEAQDLIQNEHVLAFVGNIQVLTIDAMTDTINKTKIPMIGGDITNDTWFSSPYIFPEGPPSEAISYGYLEHMKNADHATKVADIYCIEVPQACRQIDTAFRALAPQFGLTVAYDQQVSITSPSYTSQCLAAQSAGVEVIALTFDAPSMSRFANSCSQAGYHPKWVAYPLGVGNEGEFFGNANLGGTYVPLNTFPWMSSGTPAEKFYQASVAKYNPGFATGDAAVLGWTSGAMLVKASESVSDTPTTQEILNGLYSFKNETLGGLAAPLTFAAGQLPVVPYCLFGVTSNPQNTGWVDPVDKPVCTTVTAPGSPK